MMGENKNILQELSDYKKLVEKQEDLGISDYKELFQQQKKLGISNFKEYLRDKISKVLEKKDNFRKKDCIEVELQLNNKKEFYDILKKYKSKFSYQFLDQLIFLCKTPEKFLELCEKQDFGYILENVNENILEIFIKTFSKNLNLEFFGELCQDEYLVNTLMYLNKEALKYFIKIFGQDLSLKEFLEICRNKEFKDNLSSGISEINYSENKKNILKHFPDIKFTKEIILISIQLNENNLKNFLEVFGENLSGEKFGELYKDKYFKIFLARSISEINYSENKKNILKHFPDIKFTKEIILISTLSPKSTLLFFIESFGKKMSSEKFTKICKNEYFKDTLMDLNENNLKFFLEIFGKEISLKKIIKLYKNKNFISTLIFLNKENLNIFIEKFGKDVGLNIFLELFENNEDFRNILKNSNSNSLKDFFEEFGESLNLKEFLDICKNNENFRYILKNSNGNGLKRFFEKSGKNLSLDKFLELCENEDFINTLKNASGNSLKNFFEKFGKDLSLEKFLELCKNKNFIETLSHSYDDDLKYFFEKLSKDLTLNKFLKLCENEDFINILKNLDSYDLEPFLKSTLGDLNLEKIIYFKEYFQSKNIFKEDFEEFKEKNPNVELNLENFLGYFSKNSLDKKNLKEVSEKERNENILKVNKKQKEELGKLNFENKNFYLEKNEKNRDLVLYFRGAINSFEFLMVSKILNDYVGKYSKVFNKIKIVGRGLKEIIPDNVYSLGDCEYLNVKGDGFEKATNIYANTVHLGHGTPYNRLFSKTSSHIVSECIEEERLSGNGKEIIIDFNYVDLVKVLNTNSGKSLPDICDEILRAVIACEDKMLKEIE